MEELFQSMMQSAVSVSGKCDQEKKLLLPDGQSPEFRRFKNCGVASCGRKTAEKFCAEGKVGFCGKATPVYSRAAGCGAEME